MKLLKYMTEPELRDLLNELGNGIEHICTIMDVEKPMFALLLFNDPGIAQYVCNCSRDDVITAMRECAARMEAKQDIPR